MAKKKAKTKKASRKIKKKKVFVKKKKIVVKNKKVEHPLVPRILITLFIFSITAIIILYRMGKFSINNPVAASILGALFGLFILYIIANVSKIIKKRKEEDEKKEKIMGGRIKKEISSKSDKYETDLDRLYKLINKIEEVNITEVSESFSISKEQAEEWGKILESHDLIEINYPTIGEMRLCKKKKLKST